MELTVVAATLVLAAVVVGAVLQRVSGTGMGLVLAPMLTLIVGAGPGVLITNVTTTMSAFLLMLAMRKDVDWRRALLIMGCALPGAVLGALVVRATSAAWLQVIVGGVVLAAIGVMVLLAHLGRLPHVRQPWLTPSAGLLGGIFNTVAGVAAPVMVIHARVSRWEQARFAASMQPVFMTMGAASVAAKSALGSVQADLPPWWMLPASLLCVVAGIGLGGWLAGHVSSAGAGRVALVLAGLGGASALVRGLLALV